MGKSFKDYDKVTVGGRVGQAFKVFAMAIIGAMIGSIPSFVLLVGFNLFTVLTCLFSGALAMVIYGMRVPKADRRGYDHPIIITGTALGLFIMNFLEFLFHYAPSIVLEGNDLNDFQKTIFTFFTHARFDSVSSQGIITADGKFSVYTWYIASLIVAIIGIYVAFLFVLATDREEASGKKKR